MPKKILFTILIALTLVFCTKQVFADSEVISRMDWNADESLADREADLFNQVEKIYIVGLTLDDKEIRINTNYWVKGLYYFFTTKTQFKDIPFNFLVGWDGQVFEGMPSKPDLVSPVRNDNAIVIGYLSNYDSAEITRLGQDSLKNLLIKLTNDNNLDPSNIVAKDWKISPTDDLQNSYIEVFQSVRSAPIEKTLTSIMSDVKTAYNPKELEYKGEILEVSIPEALEVEEEYEVTVKVKNTGDTNWYKDSKSEVTICRKDNAASEYQVPNVWISSSQSKGQIQEIVMPNEEALITFNISTPFVSGEYTEKFELKTIGGIVLINSEFDLKTSINAGQYDIAQVRNTPTGYLNVRESPSTGGALITQVLPGEKFIVLEKQSSWYKIKLKDGQEGWAAKQYLEDL